MEAAGLVRLANAVGERRRKGHLRTLQVNPGELAFRNGSAGGAQGKTGGRNRFLRREKERKKHEKRFTEREI